MSTARKHSFPILVHHFYGPNHDYIGIVNDDPECGFPFRPTRSRKKGSQMLADVEFVDDVAVITNAQTPYRISKTTPGQA